MKTVGAMIPGLRVLRQDPWECLVSFITSSNNNIKRIIQGLQRVRETYGLYLCTVQQQPDTGEWEVVTDSIASTVKGANGGGTIIQLHQFPSPEEFQEATVEQLRALGMGYRAR